MFDRMWNMMKEEREQEEVVHPGYIKILTSKYRNMFAMKALMRDL